MLNKDEAMTTAQGWSEEERRVLEEARSKLKKRKTRNTAIGLGGIIVTVVSFVVGQGAGVVFFGAIIAGTLYALQDQRYLAKLDKLQPATPLNQATLGVRTSADPPPPSQKKAAIIVGSMIAIVVIAILVMVVTYG